MIGKVTQHGSIPTLGAPGKLEAGARPQLDNSSFTGLAAGREFVSVLGILHVDRPASFHGIGLVGDEAVQGNEARSEERRVGKECRL